MLIYRKLGAPRWAAFAITMLMMRLYYLQEKIEENTAVVLEGIEHAPISNNIFAS